MFSKLSFVIVAIFTQSWVSYAATPAENLEPAQVVVELIQDKSQTQPQEPVCFDKNDKVVLCSDDSMVKVRMTDVVTVTAEPLPVAPVKSTIPNVNFGAKTKTIEVTPRQVQKPKEPRDFAIGAVIGMGAVAGAYHKSGPSGVGDENFNPMGGLRFQMDSLNFDLFLNKNTLGTGWDARVGYFILPFYHRNGIRAIFGYGQRKRLDFMKEPEKYINVGTEAIWRGEKFGFALGTAWDRWLNIPEYARGLDGKTYVTSQYITPNTMRIYANIEIVFKGRIHDSGAE